MGINGHIHRYARNRHGTLHVIDVGCSYGMALQTTQKCLKKHGTYIRTIGIDSSPAVESNALKNLNHFVLADVLSLKTDRYIGTADIVICANAANWLYKLFSFRDTTRIIKRSIEFLKKNGILVTDSPDANSMHDLCRLDWKCTHMCQKSSLNLCYKLNCLRKSSAYIKT